MVLTISSTKAWNLSGPRRLHPERPADSPTLILSAVCRLFLLLETHTFASCLVLCTIVDLLLQAVCLPSAGRHKSHLHLECETRVLRLMAGCLQ